MSDTDNLPELTPAQRAEAEGLGVSEEAYRAALAVEAARAARQLGLSLAEYAELEAAIERARAKGRGTNVHEWAAATGRNAAGGRQRDAAP